MKQLKKIIRYTLYIALIAVLSACASKGKHFPEPKKLEPMVAFWEKVYSQWDENQAVFHDDRHLDVIYDIVTLPSDRQMRATVLSNRQAYFVEQLKEMEERQRLNQPLSSEQKKWSAMLKKSGGGSAIYGASERVRYQTGLKSRYKKGLENSYYYLPEFKAIMKKEGVPEELAYLPHVESSFQNIARSHAGAAGMWQFMPSTGRLYFPMEKNTIDGRLDPFIAAKGAARYLKEAHSRLNSWPLALTAYNHGVGGLVRAKNTHGPEIDKIVWEYQGDRFKFASRNFYAEFIAAKTIAENPEKYFGSIHKRPQRQVDAIQLFEPMLLNELIAVTNLSASELIHLNPAWQQNILNNRKKIPANMQIWVPKGKGKQLPSQYGNKI